jgi:hypothetical protein
MLLLTRNSAQARAKQKPRQWGPLSSVQSAVRHNCERFGIGPAPSLLFSPMVAADRSRDLMTGLLSVSDPAPWKQGPHGLEMDFSPYNADGQPSRRWDNLPSNFSASPKGTFFTFFRFRDTVYLPSGQKRLWSDNVTKFYSRLQGVTDTTDLKIYFTQLGVADYVTTGTVDLSSGYHSVCIVHNGVGGAIDAYIDGLFFEALTSSAGSYSGGSTSLEIGSPGVSNLNGLVPVTAVWQGECLTAGGVQNLHTSALAITRPYTPPVWIDLGAGAGPTYKVPVISRHYRNRRAA